MLCSAAVYASSAESSISSPRRGRASTLFAHPGPYSGGDRTPLPPPSTLQDQSDPCLALRESRSSSPRRAPLAILSTTCTEMLSGGFWEATPNRCLLAPLPEAVPSWQGSSREERPRMNGALETPVSPAPLLRLPLGAGLEILRGPIAPGGRCSWLCGRNPFTLRILWALLGRYCSATTSYPILLKCNCPLSFKG